MWCMEMPRAYVLFSVGSGSEDQVRDDVRKVEGVEEVFVSYGVYDLVVKIKADSMEQLKELVTQSLRRIDNLRSTLKLILVDE